MKSIIFLAVLPLSILASCTSGSKGSEETKTGDSLTVEFIGSAPLDIKNPEGKVQLYAVAENIADVPATLLEEKNIQQSGVPFTIDFFLLKDHKSHIKPAIAAHEAVKYYVTVKWDSDGNGKVEKGDIMIDYDKQFPNVKLGAGKQQVYLTVIK